MVPLQQGHWSGSPPPSFAEATEGRPDFQDEIAPKGAHVAGGLFGWWWNKEDLGMEI